MVPHNESSTNTNQTASRSQARAKLPTLTLPKFRGDVTMWNTFWDSFQSAIHNNQMRDISKVNKFNYFNSVLEGSAVNFDCVELGKRCEKFFRIVSGKHSKLLQHTWMSWLKYRHACHNDCPTSLQFVYDQINVHARGLASLGVSSEQYGSLLVPIIMSKRPSEIRLQVARNSTKQN